MKFSKGDKIPHTIVDGKYYIFDKQGVAAYAVPTTSATDTQLFIISYNGIPAGEIPAHPHISEAQHTSEKAKYIGSIPAPKKQKMDIFLTDSGEILGFNKKYVNGFFIKPKEFRAFPFEHNGKTMYLLCGFNNDEFCGLVCPVDLSKPFPDLTPDEILAWAKRTRSQKSPRKIVNLTEKNLEWAINYLMTEKHYDYAESKRLALLNFNELSLYRKFGGLDSTCQSMNYLLSRILTKEEFEIGLTI